VTSDNEATVTGNGINIHAVMMGMKRSLIRWYQALASRAPNTFIAKIPLVKTIHRLVLYFIENVLVARSEPQWIRYGRSYLYLDPTDHVGEKLYKTGECEPEVHDAIKGALTDGDTAIDIGGHIGHHAVTMREQVGESGEVLIFEPHPENVRYIRKTVNRNGWTNVHTHETALSDEKTVYTLTENTGNSGNASIKQGGDLTYKVESERLSELDLGTLDLIKIDIEGAEVNVVRDMENGILEKTDVLLIEVHTEYLTGDEMTRIYEILAEAGELSTLDGEPLTSFQEYRAELRDVHHRNLMWVRE
jgi:FkbM family methyltransferase